MKFDLKSWGSREDWEYALRRVLRFFSRLSRAVLVTRIRATELMLTVIVLAVTVGLGFVLLYLPPRGVEVVEEKPLTLNTTMLDFLVDWRQARARGRESGLAIPTDTLFP